MSYDFDGCVVETPPLCNLLRTFTDRWYDTRPPQCREGRRGGANGDVDPTSPYVWLADETCLPVDEIRKVRSPRRYPLAELAFADALVTVIGDPGMFTDGTLVVIPNPLVLDPTRRAECCTHDDTRRRVWFQLDRAGPWLSTVLPVQPASDVTPGVIIRATLAPARPCRAVA